MAFPPSFLEEICDKVPLSSLIGKKVKLSRRGHEYTGLCPFHHEKTASFTINDDKGFYHCFGCGAHGNQISYLMEAEKLPFMEAVEYLANLAGVKMPEMTKEQKTLELQRNSLTAIMEEACQFFQAQLFGLSGTTAKNYLIKRGISGTVAKQFRLGYAPSGSALTQHLEAKGFDLKECQKLGIVVQNKETGKWHDYFYDRVMFPILDRRKHVIGFGGRMMEKGEPKYLNSPETALFHKGEQLYALPNAIETMRKKNEAILVEGYMDVIALHSAGFTNAVAPLGTAFTENQIRLLWQSCDEPFICFDGDGAGQKAAIRALYRALPILVPGKSLRFVTLPNPYDPDDVIRKKSPEAFQEFLKTATGFADKLWNHLLSEHVVDTPERLALFEKEVKGTVAKIENQTVREYYQKDFKDRLWKLTHTKPSKRRRIKAAPIYVPETGAQDARMMMTYLILYPEIAESLIEDISALMFPDNALNELLGDLCEIFLENSDLTTDKIKNILGSERIAFLAAEIEMVEKSNRTAQEVNDILLSMLKNTKVQSIENEITKMTQDYLEDPKPELWERIKELKQEIIKLTETE